MHGNFVCGNENCTACGACVDACAFNALRMEEAKEDLVPVVDSALCKDCGRCHAVCPALRPVNLNMPFRTIAAWSCDNDDVERSSSGGLAASLARFFIENGGVVFGTASIDGRGRCAEVVDATGLEQLRGSKYVYSSPEGAYRRIKRLLGNGAKVLFISTPCQVAALRAFIGEKSDGLLCVDLICHGTPPMSYLREHLDAHASQGWDSFSFRGVRDFRMCAYKGGALVYDKPCFEDEYFSVFEAGAIHRSACYECPYARNERVGDLTLGDFWGLDKTTLGSVPPGKVSVVLVNTQTGLDALVRLPDTVVLEEREFSEADNAEQTNLHTPSPKSKDHERFVKAHEKVGFDEAVRRTWAWRRFRLRILKHKVLGLVRK